RAEPNVLGHRHHAPYDAVEAMRDAFHRRAALAQRPRQGTHHGPRALRLVRVGVAGEVNFEPPRRKGAKKNYHGGSEITEEGLWRAPSPSSGARRNPLLRALRVSVVILLCALAVFSSSLRATVLAVKRFDGCVRRRAMSVCPAALR